MNNSRAAGVLALILLLAKPAAAEEERDLDGMAVIGSHELPKALYIVPWKDADLGAPPPSRAHGLSDDPLRPLDRGVFQRELHYHDKLNRN